MSSDRDNNGGVATLDDSKERVARRKEEEKAAHRAAANAARGLGGRQAIARDAGQGGTFVLLSGDYKDLDGNYFEYQGPDNEVLIDSHLPLDELWANKFRRVEGETLKSRDEDVTLDHGSLGIMDPPLAERHPEGIKTQFSADTEPAEARRRERAEGLSAKKGGKKYRAAPAEEEEADLGDDVTEQFEGAAEAELKVFKQGREYAAYDAANLKKTLNEEPLTNKTQVKEFIETYTK